MSKRSGTIQTAWLAVFFATAGCASTSEMKNLDSGTMWVQATEKLKAGKWSEAARLFERFTLEFPTDTRYQEARYHLGEAHFGGKQYITAATEFGRLASDYPAGPYADDSQFKVCESYSRLSPDIELDQQYTQAAIDQCQILLSYFPGSEFVPQGTVILSEMIDKLAHKLFWTGDYYFRRKAYDPAILYYEMTAKTYPVSAWAPRALARMIESYRILKYDTEEAATRSRLLREFPTSPEAKAFADAKAPAAAKPDSVARR